MKSLQSTLTAALIFLFMLTGCDQPNESQRKNTLKDVDKTNSFHKEKVQTQALNDSLRKVLIKKGTEISYLTASILQSHLKEAVKRGDLQYAMKFCKNRAMVLTDSIAKAESVRIKRLAKKYRNPKNETNTTESQILKTYLLQWLGGKPLKPQILVNGVGHPVYYRPIYITNSCLNCHGVPGVNVTPELEKTIQELYPDDKATGFKKGWLRGMWAITFPEYKVK